MVHFRGIKPLVALRQEIGSRVVRFPVLFVLVRASLLTVIPVGSKPVSAVVRAV